MPQESKIRVRLGLSFLAGERKTGKTITCNELQQELLNKGDECFKVCTPTSSSSF
jgi:hypothetical protein